MAREVTCVNSVIMEFKYSQAEKPKTRVDAMIEVDETDDADTAIELELLAARVQAARHCGA